MGQDLIIKSGVKDSFWDYSGLISSSLILIPLRAISAVMIVRILGAEGYGTLALYTSVFSLAHLFISTWSVASVLRFGRQEYDRSGKINQTFWARNIILTPCLFFGILVILVLNDPICEYIGMPRWAIVLLIASVLLSMFYNYMEYILQAVHQMKAFAAFQLMGSISSIVGLSFLFFKFFHRSYLTVITVSILSGVATVFIAACFWVPLRMLLPIKCDRQSLRDIFSFSYPLLLGSLSSFIVTWVDVLVINNYYARSVAGGYQIAYQVFTFVIGLAMTITVLVAPILTSFIAYQREELIKRYASRLVPQGVLFWSIVIGIGLAISEPVFRLLFGKQFSVSAIYFQYLVLGAALNSIVSFHSGILTAYKLTKYIVLVSFCTALLNLSGDLLFVRQIGPVGAALSTTAAIGVHSLLYLLICKKQLGMKLVWELILVSPVFLSFGVIRIISGPWAYALAIGINLASGYYLAKAFHLFRSEDIDLLDYIEMPALVRKSIAWVYLFLERGNQNYSNGVNS